MESINTTVIDADLTKIEVVNPTGEEYSAIANSEYLKTVALTGITYDSKEKKIEIIVNSKNIFGSVKTIYEELNVVCGE